MNMNYEVMWEVVDAHRRCADELERTLRKLTGDQPEPERDDIEAYGVIKKALTEAREQLHMIADREGHSVRRRDATRCRIFAGRCDMALITLWKSTNA